MRRLLLWACLVGMWTGCGPGVEDAAEIRLGMVSEKASAEGEVPILIVEQVVREINAGGGVDVAGTLRPIRLIVQDTAASPEGAIEAALRLINTHRVVALIGPSLSDQAIPVARVAQRSQVPMISPGSTHPETTEGKPFAFRIPFTDAVQSRVLAKFARQDLELTRMAVLFDVASDYSRGIATQVMSEFEALGGEMVAFEGFTVVDGDVRPAVSRLVEARPEVLFLPHGRPWVHAKLFRAMGGDAIVLGSDLWPINVLQESPMEGAFYSHNWHPDAVLHLPNARTFREDYQRRYGVTPDGLISGLYDTVHLFMEAIRRAGSDDPSAIRDQLASIEDFSGATVPLTYRGTSGDPPQPIFIIQIQGGEQRLHRVIQPGAQ